MKPIILFDIDYTLINTSRLRELIETVNCSLLRIDPNHYRELAGEYAAGLKSSIKFSPRNYLRFLDNKLKRPLPLTDLLANYFSSPILYRQALYLDTIAVLKQLSPKFSLGIFSEGVKEFQIAKIDQSGIVQYLDPSLIFIYPDKTSKASALCRKIGSFFLVDDNPRHLVKYLEIKAIDKVLVTRGVKYSSYTEPLSLEIKQISNLAELPALIDKAACISLSSQT